MNENLQKLMEIRLANTRKALEEHRFPTYACENVEELRTLVSSLIKDGEQVSVGGSATLEETGILDMLRTRELNFIEHDRRLPKEVQLQKQRMAFSSDTFLCSANAISENGEIYNVDGTGNRVAAMMFGPKQVILVVSVNKIVKNWEEMVKRVENIAAPANALRLQKETPCAKTGHCMDCHSKDRICAMYVTMRWQQIENRIKVIFIKEPFGY